MSEMVQETNPFSASHLVVDFKSDCANILGTSQAFIGGGGGGVSHNSTALV